MKIGSIEKMSKSKRNTVDPDDIIGEYGADVARWFMLSDSPPDRDVIWTEEGVQGSWRFVQRLWRLVHEVAEIAGFGQPGRRSGGRRRALALRKAAHGALAKVSEDVPRLRFNRCVAHIYELANALQAALTAAKGQRQRRPVAAAMREAIEIMVQLFAPMMPHLAEECWAALGHKTLIAEAPWPQVEARAAGRGHHHAAGAGQRQEARRRDGRRATPVIPRSRRAVLELEAVRRALEGKPPKKVIVVPQRIVNVVA